MSTEFHIFVLRLKCMNSTLYVHVARAENFNACPPLRKEETKKKTFLPRHQTKSENRVQLLVRVHLPKPMDAEGSLQYSRYWDPRWPLIVGTGVGQQGVIRTTIGQATLGLSPGQIGLQFFFTFTLRWKWIWEKVGKNFCFLWQNFRVGVTDGYR